MHVRVRRSYINQYLDRCARAGPIGCALRLLIRTCSFTHRIITVYIVKFSILRLGLFCVCILAAYECFP